MMYLRIFVLLGCLCWGFGAVAQETRDTTVTGRMVQESWDTTATIPKSVQETWDTAVTAKPVQEKDTVIRVAALPPVKTDSLLKPVFFTPKKVALLSSIVPGLGQFYNKQYWKIGVIYVGVGAAIYFVQDNLKNYNDFRRLYAAYQSQNTSITDHARYTASEAKGLQDYYRRNLDVTVLITALGYTLQMVDAVVFAHLKNFDISEDISLRARPVLMPQGGIGFGLVMNFK